MLERDGTKDMTMAPFRGAREACNSTREREQGKHARKYEKKYIDVEYKLEGVHSGRGA
jgi:hypothetical protein